MASGQGRPNVSSDAQALRGVPVDTTAPTTGNALVFDGTKWVPATANLPSRTTANFTTASLLNGAVESGSLVLAKSYLLLQVQVDKNARVRLYQTAAKRNADVARAFNQSLADPPYVGTAHGCDLDLDLDGTVGLTFPVIFECGGRNMDTPPTTTIYYNVTNESGSTGTVTVTLTYEPLEN